MEDIRGIQHPLQTPLVLECIFKNLGVSDLKACREVCRAWGQEATKVMRPLVYVDIIEFGANKFLELVQSEASTLSESPFVDELRIITSHHDYAGIAPTFWEFCGRIIKSFCLSKVSFESGDEFDRAVFQSCPNLEKLTLEDVHVDGDWIPTRFPEKANLKSLTVSGGTEIIGLGRTALLSHCSCLEELKVCNAEVSSDWIFESLVLQEQDNEGWPLKNISVSFVDLKESIAILPLFVDGRLALETFKAGRIETPEHATVVRKILEANAKSLKDLSLEQTTLMVDALIINSLTPPNNIVLEKLEKLYLNYVDLTSVSFLRGVPNLRHLAMRDCFSIQPGLDDGNGEDWVLTSCTDLYMHNDFESEELEQLLRRLPNLENLEIRGCDNEKFAVICKLVPKLTFLELLDSEVDDCGISGLDLEDVERINEEGANGWAWWRPITVARPNITNLQSLKSFSHCGPFLRPRQGTKCYIGFPTALCGVQQLPQLQHLFLEERSLLILQDLMEQFPPWNDRDE